MKHPSNGNSAIVRPQVSRLPCWAVVAILAFLIGVVYLPAVNAPLIFDDLPGIAENGSIVSLWPLIGIGRPGPFNPQPEYPTSGRPLVNLAFAIVYHFGGPNPAGYHLLSIAVHFCNAILLWAITRRTLRLPYFQDRFNRSAEWIALAVSVLWAMHPLQTEAVIYATQCTELMMALFYLATLYCSLRYWDSSSPSSNDGIKGALASSRNVWLFLATLACLCGMASKEVMVSAPLVVLLFERAFIAGTLEGAIRRSWPLYLGLALTWLLLAALVLTFPRSDSAGFHVGVPAHEWWLTQSKIFFLYLKLVVWPWPLLIHYELPYLARLADAWIYVVPLLLVGALTLVSLWRNRPFGFLGAWFFAILSPTLVIPIFTEMAAERRMYLALAPILLIVVVGGYRLAEVFVKQKSGAPKLRRWLQPMVVGVPILLLILVYCFVTAVRLTAYDDEMNLWVEVVQSQPDNSRAHLYLGSFLEKRGNDNAAIEQYREAIRVVPLAAQAHYQLALLLNKRGSHEEAASHFALAALSLPKRNATMHNDMAVALYMAGHNEEAIKTFRTALEIDPNFWPAYRNMGTALQKAGEFQDAVESFKFALRLNPQAIDIYNDLANSYFRLGQKSQAVVALEQGLELAKTAGDYENIKKYTAALEAKR